MSIEIMNRVWSQSRQQGTKLVLLLALADMANSNGYCWPSLETLQQRARLSHRQNVIKAIAEMESGSEIWVEHSRGRNRSNTYIITVGMSVDELAKTLIAHFDYQPSVAMQKANDFLKRSRGTTLSKCSPQAENVVGELHLSNENVQENVVVGLKNVVVEHTKCSPQTTRSVIEPSIDPKEEDQGETPKECDNKNIPSPSLEEPLPLYLQPGYQDPMLAAAQEKFDKRQASNGRYVTGWQANLNLELSADKRVPLVNALARVCGLTKAMTDDDTAKNVHTYAVKFYNAGCKTEETINATRDKYLADTWRRQNHPKPSLTSFFKFYSQQSEDEPQAENNKVDFTIGELLL